MDFIKNLFNDLKTSPFVEKLIGTLKPTENWLLNKGAIKVLVMTIPLYIINIILAGVATSVSIKIGGFFGWIISILINIIIFLFTSMGATIACLHGFDMLVNKRKQITMSEFLYITRTKAIDFTVKYIQYVALYTIAFSVMAYLINMIPAISGYAINNLITAFLVYGLTYRMYAFILGKNGDVEAIEKKEHWIMFALFAYIIDVAISSMLVDTLFKYIFILFTVVSLNEEANCNTNKSSDDDFEDGFEDVIKDEKAPTKNYSNNDIFEDDFEDAFQF